MPDFFTRADAEAMLPRITPMLREIQRLRQDQRVHLQTVAADQAKVLGNGHMPREELLQHQHDGGEAEERMVEIAHALSEMGVLLKDPDTGLVDFPTLRDGHEVYLCWQLGESRIAWWHEISAGFLGRQPLEDDE
jgi:hypothetical protein